MHCSHCNVYFDAYAKETGQFFCPFRRCVFFTTAFAKIMSALGDAGILHGPDPIFGLEIRTVLLVAASIESIVALVCLRGMRSTLQVGLVLWLSNTFVLYRVGLWIVKYDKPCPCLGTMTDALHISPQAADLAMKILLAYLLIGSYGILFWQWRQGRAQKVDPPTVAPARQEVDG